MIKSLLKSFAFAVLMVVFPVIASVIIQVRGITDDTTGYGIQAVFFAIAALVGLFIYRKLNKKKDVIRDQAVNKRQLLWFIPIIIAELIVFISGINVGEQLLYYFMLLLFTVFVGISEELFFRGIILNILKSKGIKYAIVVSSILFSILHLTNLAGGIDIKYAILQVIFSFIFGFVAAQITIISQSILPAMIWHFAHDFISFVTGNELNTTTTIILVVQCSILVLYSLYLNKKISN